MSVIYIDSYRFGSAYDADAQAYIAAVEAADTAAGSPGGLETAVKDAINTFVVGCKADGIWNAIKASCILSGARTLEGALQPLAGAAPTNVGGNFTQADYSRKTGLIGNRTTKYLNSNRLGSADPQNSFHASCFVSTSQTGTDGRALMGALSTTPTVSRSLQLAIDDGRDICGVRSSGFLPSNRPLNSFATGFIGGTRPSSASFDFRFAATQLTKTETSLAPPALNTFVFAQNFNGSLSAPTDARLAFYSIGESLDLALLDARVTTLINAFAAAIP